MEATEDTDEVDGGRISLMWDDFDPETTLKIWLRVLTFVEHLRDPRTLCIVFPFEISNLPPHCVAHRKEEKQQQPYSGDSSVYGCSPQKRRKTTTIH